MRPSEEGETWGARLSGIGFFDNLKVLGSTALRYGPRSGFLFHFHPNLP